MDFECVLRLFLSSEDDFSRLGEDFLLDDDLDLLGVEFNLLLVELDLSPRGDNVLLLERDLDRFLERDSSR